MGRPSNPMAIRVGVARARRTKAGVLGKARSSAAPSSAALFRQADIVDASSIRGSDSRASDFNKRSSGRTGKFTGKRDGGQRRTPVEAENARSFSTFSAAFPFSFRAASVTPLVPRKCVACSASSAPCASCCAQSSSH